MAPVPLEDSMQLLTVMFCFVLSYLESISPQGTVLHSPEGAMTLRPHAEVGKCHRLEYQQITNQLCMCADIVERLVNHIPQRELVL
jgi:hypothetical protein